MYDTPSKMWTSHEKQDKGKFTHISPQANQALINTLIIEARF
jgi:hypothetical protein